MVARKENKRKIKQWIGHIREHRSLTAMSSDVAGVDVLVLLGDGGADDGARLDKGNSMAKSRASKCSSSSEIARRRLQSNIASSLGCTKNGKIKPERCTMKR